MRDQRKVEVEGLLEPKEDTEILLDVYETEIKHGDTYFENKFGEFIHITNLLKYIAEENWLEEKTR